MIDLEGVLEHAAAIAAEQRRHVAPEQHAVEVAAARGPRRRGRSGRPRASPAEPSPALPRISVGRIQKPNSSHLPDGTDHVNVPSSPPGWSGPAPIRDRGACGLPVADDPDRGHRDQSPARSRPAADDRARARNRSSDRSGRPRRSAGSCTDASLSRSSVLGDDIGQPGPERDVDSAGRAGSPPAARPRPLAEGRRSPRCAFANSDCSTARTPRAFIARSSLRSSSGSTASVGHHQRNCGRIGVGHPHQRPGMRREVARPALRRCERRDEREAGRDDRGRQRSATRAVLKRYVKGIPG